MNQGATAVYGITKQNKPSKGTMKKTAKSDFTEVKEFGIFLFRQFPRRLSLLFVLILITAFMESFGILMLLPILELLANNNDLSVWSSFVRRNLLDQFSYKNQVALVLLLFLGFLVAKNALVLIRSYISSKTSTDILKVLQTRLMHNYIFCRYDEILKSTRGELTNRIMVDGRVCSKAIDVYADFFVSLAQIAALASVMIATEWKISLCLISAGFVFFFGIGYPLRNLIVDFSNKIVIYRDILTSQIVDALETGKDIRFFGLQFHSLKTFSRKNAEFRRFILRRYMIHPLIKVTSEILGVIIVVSTIAYMFFIEERSPQYIIAFAGFFVVITHKLQQSISTLIEKRTRIYSQLPSARAILPLMDSFKPESTGTISVNSIDDSVRFANLNFTYTDTDKPVFANFTYEFSLNRKYKVVGASGKGKSTLVNLLTGLVQPEKRQIFVDHKDITDLKIDDYRQRLSYASQDARLVNESIFKNIEIGAPGADRDRVLQAAKLACADGFIEKLSESYDTRLIEHGKNLSGGQIQRIIIARALVREADIYIFDEVTSALDKETEEKVLEKLFNHLSTKCIIFITHKESTAHRFDEILNLNEM